MWRKGFRLNLQIASDTLIIMRINAFYANNRKGSEITIHQCWKILPSFGYTVSCTKPRVLKTRETCIMRKSRRIHARQVNKGDAVLFLPNKLAPPQRTQSVDWTRWTGKHYVHVWIPEHFSVHGQAHQTHEFRNSRFDFCPADKVSLWDQPFCWLSMLSSAEIGCLLQQSWTNAGLYSRLKGTMLKNVSLNPRAQVGPQISGPLEYALLLKTFDTIQSKYPSLPSCSSVFLRRTDRRSRFWRFLVPRILRLRP